MWRGWRGGGLGYLDVSVTGWRSLSPTAGNSLTARRYYLQLGTYIISGSSHHCYPGFRSSRRVGRCLFGLFCCWYGALQLQDVLSSRYYGYLGLVISAAFFVGGVPDISGAGFFVVVVKEVWSILAALAYSILALSCSSAHYHYSYPGFRSCGKPFPSCTAICGTFWASCRYYGYPGCWGRDLRC